MARFNVRAVVGGALSTIAASIARQGTGFAIAQGVLDAAFAVTPPELAPSEAWNGTADSGFAVAPVDPARTTAKPALRMITVPWQTYTDELLVGALAMANDNGSLLVNLGIEKVTFHLEGNSVDVDAPSFQTFDDVNGNPVTYYGWWVRLKNDGRHGKARFYAEATARDGTMQKRVIGMGGTTNDPAMWFYPKAVLHSHVITIEPTPAEIAGVRYKGLNDALYNWLYANRATVHNPLIRIVEPGTYTMTVSGNNTYANADFVNITADVPVTIAHPTYSAISLRWYGTHIYGENITFDLTNISVIGSIATSAAAENHTGATFWIDGLTFNDTRGLLNFGTHQRAGNARFTRGRVHVTECTFNEVHNPLCFVHLGRGCRLNSTYNDAVLNAKVALGNVIRDHHSEPYKTPVAAMALAYTGAGAATLSGAGTAGTQRTFTARVDGVTVGTLIATVPNDETYTKVADVVAWINGLAGWSATLIDNTRRGAALYLGTGQGGGVFTNAPITAAPLTLFTAFDLHDDIWTHNHENQIVYGDVAYDVAGQDFFQTLNATDSFFVNTAVHNDLLMYGGNDYLSQVGGISKHAVIAHCSFANQKVTLRYDLGYTPDAYCLIANNAARGINNSGAITTLPTMANNHVQATSLALPGSVGTTIGGDETSLFADAATGDFTPAGELRANLKAPALKYDQLRRKRAGLAPAGARL